MSKSPITCHGELTVPTPFKENLRSLQSRLVLDASTGKPAADVECSLECLKLDDLAAGTVTSSQLPSILTTGYVVSEAHSLTEAESPTPMEDVPPYLRRSFESHLGCTRWSFRLGRISKHVQSRLSIRSSRYACYPAEILR